MNIWIAGKDLMKIQYRLKKFFYSELNSEGISDADYEHVKKNMGSIWNKKSW